MTTKEFIKILQKLDRDGNKTITLYVEEQGMDFNIRKRDIQVRTDRIILGEITDGNEK